MRHLAVLRFSSCVTKHHAPLVVASKVPRSAGLVALWREALLAQAVLRGQTGGYRNPPQLGRFGARKSPLAAIGAWLDAIHGEAAAWGYAFDRSKIVTVEKHCSIGVTTGQIAYAWQDLLRKLAGRSPDWRLTWRTIGAPQCYPLFQVGPGAIEPWERVNVAPGKDIAGT
ncbi:MAG: pyrimidine dimer DNA glycosylase/endonuclease V [Noviherbaspirillum sp.]